MIHMNMFILFYLVPFAFYVFISIAYDETEFSPTLKMYLTHEINSSVLCVFACPSLQQGYTVWIESVRQTFYSPTALLTAGSIDENIASMNLKNPVHNRKGNFLRPERHAGLLISNVAILTQSGQSNFKRAISDSHLGNPAEPAVQAGAPRSCGEGGRLPALTRH